MQVKHSISIIKPDGKTTAHVVDGEWNEEGLYKDQPTTNLTATAMQQMWCKANNRMQISPIVGTIAVDLGLDADSLTAVSTELELQDNERKDNTA